ncbi:MAG: aquaporin Z [Acidimicrobiia bacterium]|nr:aquaporin Z [Acidimicrobiia bacterium]
MEITQRLGAEAAGTFVLTFGGCGSAVLAANFLAGDQQLGIGLLGVSLAFGLTVVCMAYAVGHISGGHFNPAVTVGLIVGGRFKAKDAAPYIVAQVIGAVLAAGALWIVALGAPDVTADSLREGAGAFATNGYGDLSPGGYSLEAGLIIEVLLTAVFVVVIMGITDGRAPKHFAPLAIGLALTLIHLISIPVTNTSVNPARSTGPALFVGGEALTQLWLFWLAPLVGGAIGALAYRAMAGPNTEPDIEGDPAPS